MIWRQGLLYTATEPRKSRAKMGGKVVATGTVEQPTMVLKAGAILKSTFVGVSCCLSPQNIHPLNSCAMTYSSYTLRILPLSALRQLLSWGISASSALVACSYLAHWCQNPSFIPYGLSASKMLENSGHLHLHDIFKPLLLTWQATPHKFPNSAPSP